MSFRNIMLATLGLLILTQCNTKQDKTKSTQFLPFLTKLQTQKSVFGKWRYNISMWYNATLTLYENGTFVFHDQGCFGQNFTKGTWAKNNEIIELSSYKDFQNENDSDVNISNEKLDKFQNENQLKKCPPPKFHKYEDTIRIYLDGVHLQLRNDSLFSVGTNKLPENPIFYR